MKAVTRTAPFVAWMLLPLQSSGATNTTVRKLVDELN